MAVKNGLPAGDEVAPAPVPAQEPGLERETTTTVRAPVAADTSPATLPKVSSALCDWHAPSCVAHRDSALHSGILRQALQPHVHPFTALSALDESKLSTQLGRKIGL